MYRSPQEYVDAHNEACDKLGLPPDGRVGPTLEQAKTMLETGWFVRRGDPYGQFGLYVKNYVYATKIKTRNQDENEKVCINLRMLAQIQGFAPRTRQSFQSLIYGLDIKSFCLKTSIIVYTDGDLWVMGARTRDEYLLAVSHFLRILVDCKMFKARNVFVAKETIINTVSSGMVPSEISTNTLQTKFPGYVNWRKTRFTGASITLWPKGPGITCRKIVGLAFGSNNFVMIGYRLKEECLLALFVFVYMLWSSRVIVKKRRRIGFADTSESQSHIK